jgi:hypothetical protein
MYADIPTALASIKVASELAALVLARRTDAAVKEKAIELQSSIISLQNELLSLQTGYQNALTEKEHLKQELMHMKNWEAEAQKYHLVNFGTGTFAWAIKEDQRGTQPPHHLCAHCYDRREKSILQRGGFGEQGWVYHCSSCSTRIYGPP